MSHEVNLQNQNCCKGFQISEFSGFIEFFKLLETKKVTSNGRILQTPTKEYITRNIHETEDIF